MLAHAERQRRRDEDAEDEQHQQAEQSDEVVHIEAAALPRAVAEATVDSQTTGDFLSTCHVSVGRDGSHIEMCSWQTTKIRISDGRILSAHLLRRQIGPRTPAGR